MNVLLKRKRKYDLQYITTLYILIYLQLFLKIIKKSLNFIQGIIECTLLYLKQLHYFFVSSNLSSFCCVVLISNVLKVKMYKNVGIFNTSLNPKQIMRKYRKSSRLWTEN